MAENILHQFLPGWLVAYRKKWLRPDLFAGVASAAVVIPKAMAYATIAGLPIEVGLYTAFFPFIIYVLLGTSRVLSVSMGDMLGRDAMYFNLQGWSKDTVL